MPLGSQRLFGRSNWSNFGKSFEGVTVKRNTNEGDIKYFHLINTELYPLMTNLTIKLMVIWGDKIQLQ